MVVSGGCASSIMMSDSGPLTNNAFYTEIHCEAKSYHEWTFQIEIGEQLLAMGDNGQLCDLERDLVDRPVVVIQKISVVSILIKRYRELSHLHILCFINISKELLYN